MSTIRWNTPHLNNVMLFLLRMSPQFFRNTSPKKYCVHNFIDQCLANGIDCLDKRVTVSGVCYTAIIYVYDRQPTSDPSGPLRVACGAIALQKFYHLCRAHIQALGQTRRQTNIATRAVGTRVLEVNRTVPSSWLLNLRQRGQCKQAGLPFVATLCSHYRKFACAAGWLLFVKASFHTHTQCRQQASITIPYATAWIALADMMESNGEACCKRHGQRSRDAGHTHGLED